MSLIVIIFAILIGIVVTTMPNSSKEDTNLTFKSNSTINGEGLIK